MPSQSVLLLTWLVAYLLCWCAHNGALPSAEAANVLAVLPSVWKSHYLFGQRLMQQLAAQPKRNHSVTLISPHADEDAVVAHMREIRVDGLLENWYQMGMSFDVEHLRQKSVMEHFTRLIYAGTTNVDLLLADQQVRKLLRSGERFDLLVVDLYLSEALLGLALYYGVPTVVVSPTGANTWLNEMLGNPQSSALDPSSFLPYTEHMDVWQRSVNTLMAVFEKLTYNFFHMISQQAIYEKHFQALCQQSAGVGDGAFVLSHHRELTRNLSLVLMNSNAVVQYPRAYLPNMLEVAGVHLRAGEELQLPKHLRKFIEGAPLGTVYMSLGANLRTADMAAEKLDTFLDVFAHLKQLRFVLKWELPDLDPARLSSNVFIDQWFPQEAVLTHSNVKAFVSTCGSMSVVEAINSATPILALPVHSEQEVAAKRLQAQGVAYVISYDAITYDSLLYGLQQLVHNASYAQHITETRALLRGDVSTPIDKALHYIELVLSTGGGGHMKSHAVHLNFVRTELLDVLAILAAGAFVILAVPFLVICYILRTYSQAQPNVIAMRGCGGLGDATTQRRRTSSLTASNGSAGTSGASSTSSSNTTTPCVPGTPIMAASTVSMGSQTVKTKRGMLARQETQ